MGGRETDDDDTHERHKDTNRLTRHTPQHTTQKHVLVFVYKMNSGAQDSSFLVFSPVIEKKKENTQPKGGMGGRHAATTQGF